MTAGQRSGVTIGTHVAELRVSGVAELARLAEARGYDVVLTPEAFATESFSLVTAMALATERISVGTGILSIAARPARLTAQGAATLDDASNGRFVLGLGIGHRSISEGWWGIEGYDPRLSRLREYVATVRSALAGEPNEAGFRIGFPPLRGDIPIYLAALRPGAMRLAGEVADGALLLLQPLSRMAATAAAVREGAERAGRAATAVDVCMSLMTCVTDDPEPARAAARGTLAWYANFPFYNDMYVDAGFGDEAARLTAAWARVRERDPELRGWSAGGNEGTAEFVSDAMVDAMIAIGTAEQCRARIAEVRAQGVDRVLVYPFGAYEGGREAALAGHARTIEACAGA